MISSFLLPANGVMTPEEVERRRKMADELDKQGEINGPIRTPLEGFGKLANALMGGFVRSQADKTEKKSRSNAFSAMTNALVSGGTASSQPVAASPANTKGADPGIVAYIREAAVKRGINPDIAVRVAMSEGLKANPADGWQSNVIRNGKREESYGPFQLYMGGGLGNEFVKATGLDPRNPGTVNQQVDFALDKARQGGWGPWNGAKAIGLDPWAGIDRNAPAMAQGQPQPQPGAPQAQLANYTPSMDGGMVQPAQSGGRLQQLQGLIMSPDFQWLAPEQQQFVMQAYEAERAAMNPDPMRQLQMKKLEAEIAGMGQGKPTDDMREYEAAKAQGYQGTLQNWIISGRKAGASQTNIDMKPESAFDTEAAKAQAKRFDNIITEGDNASGMIANINALREIGAGLNTGKGAEIMASLGPYAEMAGVKIDGLGEMQAYDAIVSRIAPSLRTPGVGAMSDYELRQFVKALPGLGKTPEGNAIIQNTLESVAQHKMEAARIASAVLNGEMTRQQGEKMIRELPDPWTLWKQNRDKVLTPEQKTRRYNPNTGRIE